MNKIMRLTVLLALSLLAATTFAQKKVLIESKDDIIEQATKELTEAMQPPEGSLYLWKVENNIQGEYIIDITIREKGDIASVFMAGSEGSDIKMQNMVKDRIRLFEFSFKMPTGKTYKFQYIFKFDR
jgi:hypothetical protein